MAITSTARGYVQTTAAFKTATPTNRNRMAMTSRGSKVTVVCNDIATTFSVTTRASSGDVTMAATNTGMLTINDDPDTGTAARTIHTAPGIITVFNAHMRVPITLESHPETPTTTIPPLFLTPLSVLPSSKHCA